MDSLKQSTAEIPGSGNVLLLGLGLTAVGCLLVVIVAVRAVVYGWRWATKKEPRERG